nr:GNAT family N-acetyltransferase [Flavobacterium sp.]
MGWGIIFVRDSEQWFALLIDSRFQGMGLGTFLLNELKKTQPELNGWVIDHENDLKQNGKPYLSPLAFYKKNNFEVLGNFRIENEKLSAVKIKWHSN